FWVGPGVAHYTAPTFSAREDCIRFGASADKVEVCGIPVRRAFANLPPAVPHNDFRVLMMVGAEGSPRALDSVWALLQLDAHVQVGGGRNDELRRRVLALPGQANVEALGFVENIPELMRSCDVLVTKAGGLTLAEAFCAGAPVVVYDVLAG